MNSWEERAQYEWERANKLESDLAAANEHVEMVKGMYKRQQSHASDLVSRLTEATEINTKLTAERDRLWEALTPTTETKRAYMGEFKFNGPEYLDQNGNPHFETHMIP